MLDCTEHIGNIIAIHLTHVGEVQFPMPFNVRAASISAESILYDYDDYNNVEELSLDVIKSMRGLVLEDYNNERADNVIIEPGATVKETSSLSAAGTYYTTKISCKTYDDIETVRTLVADYMAMDAFDVFIVDSEDRVFLLRGVAPACGIECAAVLPVSGTSSVEVQMLSVNGLQRITF